MREEYSGQRDPQGRGPEGGHLEGLRSTAGKTTVTAVKERSIR